RQRYAANRLIAVFDPRCRSTRQSIFEDKYRSAFSQADLVIIAGVFNPEDAKNYGDVMNVDRLVSDIAADGKQAMTLADADAIVEYLGPEMCDGDVVAVMSNGGFGGVHEKLLECLKAERQDGDK
ncbi:MAG: UDP-N-acetylmuramate:L-alanyl-gamma-D-glutamyl-meso-diaminopimelate ligase, partial [Pyrinomonadaceae bacterium]